MPGDVGFVGDVGDLAKRTQAKAGVRPHGELDKALEYELADCLWSLIAIADAFEIDLESAFHRTMDELFDQSGGDFAS
ncbi:nucleoside triphosphate pyrophosphohydrolase family protein [Tessaracoccus caeni]|uniref:MazG nucleotide pyrophosphohydrolase domain-containing protein n=1 Tax=Tessaracoccus caeni TaxID=3031239 RepID=UPI0023D9B303|nr:MazG nucleotide pyrophosphohydrolase domain-containing protein [Tessaracoccus caeni]MDF1487887.1 MazG nucleotide pyrophosphohydrolase domain-containing protein [Tessaracoccus caeni]